jgi:hypothetical protein
MKTVAQLKKPVTGFAASSMQRDWLLRWGVPTIWTIGEDLDALKWALAYHRGRNGTLAICAEGWDFTFKTIRKFVRGTRITIFAIPTPATCELCGALL